MEEDSKTDRLFGKIVGRRRPGVLEKSEDDIFMQGPYHNRRELFVRSACLLIIDSASVMRDNEQKREWKNEQNGFL